MRNRKANHEYVKLLLLHIGFAYAIYIYRPISQFILLAVLIYFTFIILQNRNKNNEALMAAAYISGAEVYFRMTDAMIFYETGKYAVVIFLLIGMFFKGTSKKTTPFWSYLLILIPGILVASITLSYEAEFRKQIVFNLSGPICLGISALYCYYKKINKEDFQKVINYLLLPLISQTIFLFLFTPTLKEDIINLSGNYVATGGYGPNQISTVLGLGVFLLVTRFFTVKNKLINFLDVILLILMGYRAVISFSRGGIFTSLICIISFLIFHYYTQRKFKQNYFSFKILLLIGSIMSIWTISSIKTFGLIQNRYENRNLAGELKDDVTTGRIDLLTTELQAFYEHPITGIGVGKGYEYRKENMGIEIASHNEFSRLLSEHGMFGVLALLILIFVPVLFWTKFKNNYYFMGFMAFWFLTINHSAMRIALPAFVYGLALLYIVDEKKHPVHRKRLSH